MLVAEKIFPMGKLPITRWAAKKLLVSADVFLFTTRKPKNTDARFLKKYKTSMKKLALLPFLFILALVAGLVWFFTNIEPVSSQISYVDFSVPSGSNAAQIGSNLYKAGLIKNPTAFKVYVQFSGVSDSIQAGDYRLSPSFNLFQIVDQLARAPIEVKVTIPEGFRNEEIAAKFAKSLDQNQSFISQFLTDSAGDEGYLFPDTYLVANNATPGAIIAKMKANFGARTAGMNFTENQVILASIIEEETKTIEERPIVAGILTNRLGIGMLLQVDVAPITYKEVGLPASPIANPGLISLEAAANPAKTDYWYYLHDSSGQIHYAKTLDEQSINIKRYLQ